MASGGLLGFGTIRDAEKVILDETSRPKKGESFWGNIFDFD